PTKPIRAEPMHQLTVRPAGTGDPRTSPHSLTLTGYTHLPLVGLALGHLGCAVASQAPRLGGSSSPGLRYTEWRACRLWRNINCACECPTAPLCVFAVTSSGSRSSTRHRRPGPGASCQCVLSAALPLR